MNGGWIVGVASLAVGGVCVAGEWVEVPRHEARGGEGGGFELGRVEVTVGEFVGYLNEAGGGDFPETAQIARRSGGGHAPRWGAGGQAVSEVTRGEAEGYSRWLSGKTGRRVRLPTEAEWEVAARGGVDGAPYPWGWGGKASEMARFDAKGPARRGGRHPANGFGLCDMAGNLYEWCASGAASSDGMGVAKGGSWAERDPASLEVARRAFFPVEYRGRDVGFRVLREGTEER